MCGIVGYSGKKHPQKILLNGLKSLEYRGYDSSGIAFKNNKDVQMIKSVGKVTNLEEKLKHEKIIDCHIGIAHTRWATHGVPSEVNAHPHRVGNVTLVHNGILENSEEIKEMLIKKGVSFKSETDTEVICALINYYYEKDAMLAIYKAMQKMKGSYALGILFDDEDALYAVRKDSPLVIGILKGEYFIASDISAIINYTNKYILLDEGEIAKLGEDFLIMKNGKKIEKQILTANTDSELKDKCGYEHFMLKEIMEEPFVLEKTLTPYLENVKQFPNLLEYEEIHIIGCGSALYAGMIGKSLLEEKVGIKTFCDVASEYRYKNIIYDRKTLVILISQSGETADTIAAMRKANQKNIDTLAIVNVKTSTIARESKMKIFIEAGVEVAVATTKAYLLQVAVLSLMAYKSSLKKGIKDNVMKEFKDLPKLLRKILNNREEYRRIAEEIYKKENIFFIGRKIDYAICLEGSLKLKEVSYIHSEAYQAGELKHGTISLIEEGMPVFGIITDKDIKEKTISNIEEVKSRGAKIILITNEKIDKYDYELVVPKLNDYAQSILIVPVLQMIAYETALKRKCDIDKPKNLAKSVTVE